MRVKSYKWHAWLSAFIFLMPLSVWAQVDIDTLKVALNYNFAKYTQWPETQTNDDLALCYFNQAYRSNFAKLTTKTVDKRAIKVIELDGLQQVSSCDIIYLDNANKKLMPALVSAVQDKAILTVSDVKGFVDAGGMIEIFSQDEHLKFNVNFAAIQQANLKLSSHVLKLAVEVRR